MQKITPFLWFDTQAEEAANFYVSLFPNSKILNTTKYDKAGAEVSGRPEGSVMTVAFTLNGEDFTAINGGPIFKFTEAVSFVISCDTQKEVDELWEKLTSNGGEEGQCGWLKDKYGLSWQVVPKQLGEMLGDPNPEKSKKVMEAMLTMHKIDTAILKQAYNQT